MNTINSLLKNLAKLTNSIESSQTKTDQSRIQRGRERVISFAEEYDRMREEGEFEDQSFDGEAQSSQIDINFVLSDQLRNTVEILRFLDRTDHPVDEVEAAKEECIERITHYFSRTRSPSIDYFYQAYMKLLRNKFGKIEIGP